VKQTRRSWAILGCAWLLGFSMYAPIFGLPPIEHIVTEELLVTHAQAGLLFSASLAMLVVFGIPSGRLADMIGTRKAVGVGAIIMAVGGLLRGTATNYGMLLGFTCLFGLGLSLVYPNLPKIVSAWFPQEQAGLATGIYTTGIALAPSIVLAITLPVIFPLTNTIQGTFYIWSIPAVMSAVLWWIVAREPPPLHSDEHGQPLNLEVESSQPVWKNKSVWLVATMLFLNNVLFYTWTGWSPALWIMKGAPPDLAAFMASVIGWIGIPVIFLMPWASFKIGLRKPFFWASAIIVAVVSFGTIYAPLSLGWPIMVLVAISVTGSFSMILALPIEMVPRESVGMASGMILSIGYVGSFVGPWVAGYIVDTTATLDLALVILTGVAIVWACLTFLLPETGHRAKLRIVHK
jgi:cyanate permease